MTTTPDVGSTPPLDREEVTRSEERLRTHVLREPSGSVRVSKRIVTEERVVTVQVRREELVVEPWDATESVGAAVDGAAARRTEGTVPVLELTLCEEVVEVVTTVVARERVRVFVDSVTRDLAVSETLRREEVDVDGPGQPAARVDPADSRPR